MGKGCLAACTALQVDMGTFDCPKFCDSLCVPTVAGEAVGLGFKLSGLYPGLTDAERKFADKNPMGALRAYHLSWKAERICKEVYFVSDTNDESDACRHFIWASLLNIEFGLVVASEILDAHEQNPDQAETEKSMDLANNRRGLIISSKLIKGKKDPRFRSFKSIPEGLKRG